ncbi:MULTISPECIES: replication initiation and membrane attachment family protein [Bacillus cereus group]|uniref:replication initiation and membrane attachment family protein n=1 Tax=Bacillus cereus group TaxID=86661 RepID=UPI0009448CE8|nr:MULTISPECIES: DnaD domain protein [Bacillus cereus group]MCU5372403.1 DnaD domain protein [Bacillus pacificus]MDA2728630.1 DnaD domain protein [Bacillus cereus]MDD7998911.1 DnaD domain protein [Bacillus cereus]
MEKQSWMELLPIDRYKVSAKGLLHNYDRKVLTMLYQPLIGSRAFSLYMTLWGELEQDRVFGKENTHHSLMVTMQMQLPEIYKERIKLEAIGLLKVYIKKDKDIRGFIYELQPPLSPKRFFGEIVLNLFLYNCVGRKRYNQIKAYFSEDNIDFSGHKEVTHSFSEVFQSYSQEQYQIAKVELDVAEEVIMPDTVEGSKPLIVNESFDFSVFFGGLSTLVPRKAITDEVKMCILQLAYVYEIDPVSMQNVVLGALTEDQDINLEKLRKEARDWYKFENNGSLPVLGERVQPYRKRTMNGVEPVTQEQAFIKWLEEMSPKQLLKEISGGSEATEADLKIIEGLIMNQKLEPGVVNVLIHYVMLQLDMKLSKSYVEKIAGHWARKKVDTVVEAMSLAKMEHRKYKEWAEGNKTNRNTRKKSVGRKEKLPKWMEKSEEAPKKDNKQNVNVEQEKAKLDEILKKYDV